MIRWAKKLLPRRRLFLRVFLHGLLLVTVLYIATGVAFMRFGGSSDGPFVLRRFADLIAKEIEPHRLEQPRLQETIDKFYSVARTEFAVYRADGALLAQTSSRAPGPVEAESFADLRQGRHNHFRHGRNILVPLLPIADSAGSREDPPFEAYLIVSWDPRNIHERILLGLAVLLVVLALMSIPLARSIARPLDQLTAAAKQFSEGHFSARANIVRKDEFGTLARTMEEMAAHLGQRIALEKELLANVSHEIRTPLTRIKVALELCDEKNASIDDVQSYLASIADDTAELEKLVDDVTTIAKLELAATRGEQHAYILRKESTPPSALLPPCQTRFAQLYPDYRLMLHLPSEPPPVEVDPPLFRRVLNNLLDNAAKHSSPSQEIELAVIPGNETLTFEVRDRGTGIDAADLPRIFEPFFRGDKARTPDIGGTGLGLTICKRIVDAHGGEIEAINRQDGGATIRVKVPST